MCQGGQYGGGSSAYGPSQWQPQQSGYGYGGGVSAQTPGMGYANQSNAAAMYGNGPASLSAGVSNESGPMFGPGSLMPSYGGGMSRGGMRGTGSFDASQMGFGNAGMGSSGAFSLTGTTGGNMAGSGGQPLSYADYMQQHAGEPIQGSDYSNYVAGFNQQPNIGMGKGNPVGMSGGLFGGGFQPRSGGFMSRGGMSPAWNVPPSGGPQPTNTPPPPPTFTPPPTYTPPPTPQPTPGPTTTPPTQAGGFDQFKALMNQNPGRALQYIQSSGMPWFQQQGGQGQVLNSLFGGDQGRMNQWLQGAMYNNYANAY